MNCMKRNLSLVGCLLVTTLVHAEESSLGLYLQGQKIGTSRFTSVESNFEGQPAKKSTSTTTMNLALMGQDLTLKIDSSSWTSLSGKPLLMRYRQESGGKWSRMEARFGAKSVQLDLNEQGRKTTRKLKLPNGTIVDDALSLVMGGQVQPGIARSFFVLDPITWSFQKNTVRLVGKSKVQVGDKKFDSTLVEIDDTARHMLTKVFLSGKGDPIKIEAPANIVMLPEPTVVAGTSQPVVPSDSTPKPNIDLATLTKIVPNQRIDNPAGLTYLKVRMSGMNLSNLPTDEHQTLTEENKNWVLEVHPPKYAQGRSYSIREAASTHSQWLEASLHIPSDSPKFIKLAKQIVGTRSTVRSAAGMIRKWVYEQMKPNAGMGILRDATDVLESKEGVCRDYAILTVTLLRAANMPARLASGMVSLDGEFYYHAWAEVWDGARWVGIDSTTDTDQISAAHIKLADGNVDTAFAFMLLDRVKMEILDSSRK